MPAGGVPQVITLPSFFNAANVSLKSVYTATTPEDILEATVEEFPPVVTVVGHVITLPSLFNAAAAVEPIFTDTTPEVRFDATVLESPP